MLAALSNLAQSYSYSYTTTDTSSSSGSMAVFWIFYLVFLVVMLVSMWKVYVKAGKPGWASIVPIYNTLVLLEIVGKPWYWILLMLIPIVNLVILVMLYHEVSKAFGKGVGMTLLLIFLPFIGWPMLAFGSATYHKPGGAAPAAPATPAV